MTVDQFTLQFLHAVADIAAEQIDYADCDKGIGYDGLMQENGEWFYADDAASADVLVSVALDDNGYRYRIFRRDVGTIVTVDFNHALRNLTAAIGFVA